MQHITLKEKAKLIISKELLAQISYFHHKVGNIEWSGILFYKILEGTIEEPSKLVIKADRFHFMDIGSPGYTEFSPDVSIMSFYDKYPEYEFAKWGMIHTHHNMNAFFSGTDVDELKVNAGAHQFYLSLIVNHRDGGNFCAKLGMIVDVETDSSYKFNNGVQLSLGATKKIEKQLLSIDCTIEYEIDEFDVQRLDIVTQNKKQQEEVKRAKQSFPTYPSKPFQHNLFQDEIVASYIPKTVKEIESYLAKLLLLDIFTDSTLKEALDLLETDYKLDSLQFEAVYFDQLEFMMLSVYTECFNEPLMAEHESKFFKQCIMVLDKYRLCNYAFYDRIIETLEMYIAIDEVSKKEEEKKTSSFEKALTKLKFKNNNGDKFQYKKIKV